MKASSKRPHVESSSGVASHPPSSGDPITEEFVDPTVTIDPPPSTSDASIRSMLETVMFIQVVHDKFWWMCLLSFRLYIQIWRVFSILLHLHLLMMMMILDYPLEICHKKGEYLCMLIGGDFVFLLIKGDLDCI